MASENDELKEILNDFIAESEEIIEKLDQSLVQLEKNSTPDNINNIFRGFHTIKGTSGFLGFQVVSKLTHSAENILNLIRKGEMAVKPNIVDVLLASLDILRFLISNIKQDGQENPPEQFSKVMADLEKVQMSAVAQKKEEKPEQAASPEPAAKTEEKGPAEADEKAEKEEGAEEKAQEEEKQKKLGELLMQEGLISQEDITDALKQQGSVPKLGEILVQKKLISQDQLDIVLKKQQQAMADKMEQTIRVEVSRLDSLMNLVGELVLGRNRLLQLNRKIENICGDERSVVDLNETITHIGMITGDLQLSIMKTRMLPIQKLFSKFPRLVRSLQKSTTKDFELKINGEDTELDKSIIEEINDPLVHILRNSVDHGIEFPEQRVSGGKNPRGTIELSAFHEGNNIIIEIKDDGKGMDTEKIREKAVKKGLVTRQKADQMTKNEILSFIFYPGFSTADIVTEISGRGVGMDVVKQNITKLKGIIDIDTEVNKGTTIRLKLPLTLAIIQALIVQVGSEFFAIPLASVVETVRISPSEIYQVEGTDIINLRGSIIPLISLQDVYGAQDSPAVSGEDKNRIYVVIVGVAEKRKGLIVDKLIGQEEIVIKSLGKYLKEITGFSGCTIMGDGRVTLIIDIEALFDERGSSVAKSFVYQDH
jgi:two-component system, chemotaxis family, sensor kinase CheA